MRAEQERAIQTARARIVTDQPSMTNQPSSITATPGRCDYDLADRLLRWMTVAGIDQHLYVPGLTRLVASYVFRVPPPYLPGPPLSQEPALPDDDQYPRTPTMNVTQRDSRFRLNLSEPPLSPERRLFDDRQDDCARSPPAMTSETKSFAARACLG